MRRLQSLLLLLALAATFLGDAVFFPIAAQAQEQLGAEQIAAYTTKLEHARGIEAQITERVACIDARDKDLGNQTGVFERRIGELRRSERVLSDESAQRGEEYESRLKNYRAERDSFEVVMRELQYYQAQKRMQEEAVRQCKQKFYPLGVLCDASLAIAQLVGAIESVESKIPAAERRVQIAGDSLHEAQSSLEESDERLAAVQEESKRVTGQARQAEEQIKDLRSRLSILRTEFQNHRLLLNDFENALREAVSVDTADARARTARQVAHVSANVDALIARVADPGNSILPEGWRKECASR